MENEKSVLFGLGIETDEDIEQRVELSDSYLKNVIERRNEIESTAYNGRTTEVMDLIED
jgi:hypothetical protein